jgi:ribosome biogenesis GTPase
MVCSSSRSSTLSSNSNFNSEDINTTEVGLSKLQKLGWQPHFSDQLTPDESINTNTLTRPVRIIEVRGNAGLHVVGADIDEIITARRDLVVAVGDWILLDENNRPTKLLERKSLMKRRAPGPGCKVQLIAANLDTCFVVSSCNQDFNVARLERYVAMALEANVAPVVVLTKGDCLLYDIDDAQDEQDAHWVLDSYLQDAKGIAGTSSTIPVVFLDARGDEPTHKLAQWCQPGKTVAFLGSSGVGKSTIVNSLCGSQVAQTGAVQEGDRGMGRQTTTRRQLYFLSNGCAILDSAGMREIQMIDAANGVAEVFSDLVELSRQCRFGNCQHAGEPGCAIAAALEKDDIDSDRLARWEKLVAEDQSNSKSLAESKGKAKALSKKIRKRQKNIEFDE